MNLNFLIKIIAGILIAIALYYLILYIARKLPPTKESKLRFCPKCGSQKISSHLKSFALIGMGSPEYSCNNCGLKSALFPIAKDENELKKIKKELKEKLKKVE